MKNSDPPLSEMTIPQIETLLAEYPWYTAARRELFLKLSARGEEYRKEALRRNLLYIYPDYTTLKQGYILSTKNLQQEYLEEGAVYVFDIADITEPDEEIADSPASVISSTDIVIDRTLKQEETSDNPEAPRKIYIVGGDYFSQDDLKEAESDDYSSLKHGYSFGSHSELDSSEFNDEDFYTETLARIYAQQELYDRANEVYEKLILLYPEKSAYFAALKKDIKKQL